MEKIKATAEPVYEFQPVSQQQRRVLLRHLCAEDLNAANRDREAIPS